MPRTVETQSWNHLGHGFTEARCLHTASGSSTGSITYVDALDAELEAAQDGLAREETNLTSYTDQLARPFEHEEALLFAQRDLARIDRKLTYHSGSSGPPAPPCINPAVDDEAAA